jgi:hypothetical protein
MSISDIVPGVQVVEKPPPRGQNHHLCGTSAWDPGIHLTEMAPRSLTRPFASHDHVFPDSCMPQSGA